MSITDENKPNERAGKRKGKAKQRAPKPDQRQRPKADRPQDDSARVGPTIALNETLPVEADDFSDPAEVKPAAAATEPRAERALVPVGPSSITMAGSVETAWIGFQTIAHAYWAHAWRSIEESMDLVEKLTLAGSIDKTVEVQNEFTRKACGGFLEDSQNIWRAYSEFASQIFRSFERLLVWRPPMAR